MIKLRYRKSVLVILFCSFILGFFFSVLYIKSSHVCLQQQNDPEQSSSGPKDFLVVVIFSAPENHKRRQVIRNTWLLTKGGSNISHFFVVGSRYLNLEVRKALEAESSNFKDLLLLETVSDSYSSLSRKLLETFRWLDGKKNFIFLLKVDDDSFVHLEALRLKMALKPNEKLYWGFFDGQARVKNRGKWQEKSWFLCDRYLPYAKGGGYVLTQDLVKLVVSMSEYLFLYQNEDVALGTWLSPFRIERLHDPQFDTEFMSRGCHNSYLVTHKQSENMMISKYNNILKTGKFCLSEHRSRNSYIYNWKVPPSMCCVRNDSQIP